MLDLTLLFTTYERVGSLLACYLEMLTQLSYFGESLSTYKMLRLELKVNHMS